MIELNAAEFPKFRCPVRAPIEPRERKVVPRAIADAKLNLIILIKKSIKSLKNNRQ